MITQELVKKLFSYNSDGSFTRISKTGTSGVIGEKFFGSTEKEGYKVTSIYNKQYRFHRLVFLYHYGWLPRTIDHIDNDRANNRIENLRPASLSQNQFNSKVPKNNTSGHKCVREIKNGYRVHFRFKGKSYSYSSKNLKDAVKWAADKRKELHGEFAREK